jgi:cbb3-type cytochrome c oxidase subunit III
MQTHFGARSLRSLALLLAASVLGALAACNQKSNAEPTITQTPSAEQTITTLATAPIDDVAKDAKLQAAALEVGKAIYEGNCAECHGVNLKGAADPALASKHAANLTDDFWMFWGKDIDTFQMHPSDVEQTIKYGVRAGSNDSRAMAPDPAHNDIDVVVMPARGEEHNLTPTQIDEVAEFVLDINQHATDKAKAARGYSVFFGKDGGVCFDCHLGDAKGDGSIGAADLRRPETWLYGADRASIVETIDQGRSGVCPAFVDKLKPGEIKAAALYVFSKARGTEF